MFFKVLAFTGLFFAVVNAQGAAWSQCGGIGWTGATTCVSGYVCTVSNPYYSQCIPGTASASSSSPPVASSPVSSPTTPSSTASSPSGTGTAPTPTGSQIRSDQDPAYHLYLQSVDGVPILGNESSCGYFTLGDTITLNNPDGSQLFFNIDDSATTDWKPVSFNATATTTTWGLSGDTIIYGSLQNFLVCPITGSSNFNLFLSTTNNMPSTDCTKYITLHLPC